MGHHHKENFFSKYIFSMDHKMISKQFLITGMFMGVVAMVLSALFRMQLANPGSKNPILEFLLGSNYVTEAGAMTPDAYLEQHFYRHCIKKFNGPKNFTWLVP